MRETGNGRLWMKEDYEDDSWMTVTFPVPIAARRCWKTRNIVLVAISRWITERRSAGKRRSWWIVAVILNPDCGDDFWLSRQNERTVGNSQYSSRLQRGGERPCFHS